MRTYCAHCAYVRTYRACCACCACCTYVRTYVRTYSCVGVVRPLAACTPFQSQNSYKRACLFHLKLHLKLVKAAHCFCTRIRDGLLTVSNDLGDLYTESGQTLQSSFSAVSKPIFATKYSLESSRRDLQNALLCTALESQFFSKILPKF